MYIIIVFLKLFAFKFAGYNFTSNDFGGLSYHRIVEAIKFAYAQRMLLEDPSFNSSVNQVRHILILSCTQCYASFIMLLQCQRLSSTC